MSSDDTVDLDPEGLADPVDGEESEPAVETAVVVPNERSLAPVDPFRRYMAEIRKYPPLTREEEQEFARKYRETGDREALFRLITANLMLVARIALSFRRAARNLLEQHQRRLAGLRAVRQRCVKIARPLHGPQFHRIRPAPGG